MWHHFSDLKLLLICSTSIQFGDIKLQNSIQTWNGKSHKWNWMVRGVSSLLQIWYFRLLLWKSFSTKLRFHTSATKLFRVWSFLFTSTSLSELKMPRVSALEMCNRLWKRNSFSARQQRHCTDRISIVSRGDAELKNLVFVWDYQITQNTSAFEWEVEASLWCQFLYFMSNNSL